LKKSLAVLEKRQDTDRFTSSDTFFAVKGVIKRKLIFKTRPKPLIPENTKKRLKR